MPKREKEVIVYIRMEEVFKKQLEEAAKALDQNLSSDCRMVLIQSLKR